VAYAAARAFEGGPQRLTRAVWGMQIVGLAIGGAVVAATGSGAVVRLLAATSWFVLALPFVTGLYLFEFFDRRWWERARFESPFEG
jgi:hypothetical protein